MEKAEKPKLTLEEWMVSVNLYKRVGWYGDWNLEDALKACWKAAQENA